MLLRWPIAYHTPDEKKKKTLISAHIRIVQSDHIVSISLQTLNYDYEAKFGQITVEYFSLVSVIVYFSVQQLRDSCAKLVNRANLIIVHPMILNIYFWLWTFYSPNRTKKKSIYVQCVCVISISWSFFTVNLTTIFKWNISIGM